MTVHFPSRAEKTLAGVRASLNAMVSNAYDPEELALRVDKLAGQLTRVAGDLRRAAKQQKKSGAAGAVHEPK